jgi:hypothetical protein
VTLTSRQDPPEREVLQGDLDPTFRLLVPSQARRPFFHPFLPNIQNEAAHIFMLSVPLENYNKATSGFYFCYVKLNLLRILIE